MGTARDDFKKGSTRKSAPAKSGVGESYDAEFVGYVNVSLSDAEKERFSSWVATNAASESFDAFVTDGVNISVKYEPRSSGFLASGTMRRVGSPNAGLVATARAKEPQLALWRLIYVLSILYGTTGHWTDVQPVASADRW